MAVAQLVEPWIVIPVVVGSSPISHPRYNPLIRKIGGFFLAIYSRLFISVFCFLSLAEVGVLRLLQSEAGCPLSLEWDIPTNLRTSRIGKGIE